MASCLNNKAVAILIITGCVFFSCKNNRQIPEESSEEKSELIMAQTSEMSNLMNAMYAYNLQAKHQIIAGEVPVAMPLDLLKLHSAEMTKGKQRTESWNSFVNVFINSQNKVLDSVSDLSITERHNEAINNCLSCHKTECIGPIPKIKKLLIK